MKKLVLILTFALAFSACAKKDENKNEKAGSSLENEASSLGIEKEKTEVAEETAEPEVSKEFLNALKKAESYAKIMHMSKKGIYDQLTSESGEGFPEDAAQYAVDTLVWDYNENAYEKAKSYQDTMSMSLNNIKDQLTSEAGEQFTAEEAEYAINKLSSEQQ